MRSLRYGRTYSRKEVMKEIRIANRELIEKIRKQGCVINNRNCSGPEDLGDVACDVDHVSSQGSGGHDVRENLMPLCRVHHTEKHQISYSGMIKKYRPYKKWLIKHERWDIFDAARTTDRSITNEMDLY